MSDVLFRGGLCTGVACAPAKMKRAEVELEVNLDSPTGISSRWKISKKRKLDDGTKLPAPCLDDTSRMHYFMEC